MTTLKTQMPGMEGAPQEYEIAAPGAAAMMQSLRVFGYDLSTAVADLVDNSITAGARNIWVDFIWDGGQSAIRVADDGSGMTEDELFQAMRPASRNPLDIRAPHDLGRFGLGLKTASFSQCQRLTVRTQTASGPVATRCWDMDYVTRTDDWRLLKGCFEGAEPYLEPPSKTCSGTRVLWQELDKCVGNEPVTDRRAQDRFLERVDIVKEHLAMVFHEFMTGTDAVRIHLNGHLVSPWDPLLSGNPATQHLPVEVLAARNGVMRVTPYVLPHHSKLTAADFARAAGPNGWNAHQGFYVYRNRRLLVPGDWLDLGFKKEEHYKLVRIRVDLPNTLDADWQVDVKKSTAKPPDSVRLALKRVAKATREPACEIYRHRGKRIIGPQKAKDHVFVWDTRVKHGRISYTINREHPLIHELLSSSTGKEAKAVLRLLEETVPVATIAINNSEKPDQHTAPFEGDSRGLKELARRVYQSLIGKSYKHSEACMRLKRMEPFHIFPEIVDEIVKGEKD